VFGYSHQQLGAMTYTPGLAGARSECSLLVGHLPPREVHSIQQPWRPCDAYGQICCMFTQPPRAAASMFHLEPAYRLWLLLGAVTSS